MKRLKRMLLVNWYFFQKEVIEFDTLTFLTGKNGTGKSTIIDALQLVLLMSLQSLRILFGIALSF